MSYILEALKKAQAERQLGSAPTIHAMPIQAAPTAHAAGGRGPMWIVLASVAVLAAVGAVAWLRQSPPSAPAVLAVQPVTAPPAVVVASQVGVPPAPPMVVAQAMPAPVMQAAPVAPAPVAPAPAKIPVAQSAPAAAAPVARATQPAAPAVRPQPVAPVAEVAAPEENLPFMSQLPEPQRSEVPKVTFGGYMYSKNPADRLLLIDKVLRHEGEEVAPGLILEQLQPKAAVMNYRGTRYRVAY